MEKATLKAKAAWLEKFCNSLGAGVPVMDVLAALKEETEEAVTKQFATDLYEDIKGGTSIAGAPSSKAFFSTVERTMFRAAEIGGRVDRVPLRMVKWLDRELAMPEECGEEEAKLRAKAAWLEKAGDMWGSGVPLFEVLSGLSEDTSEPTAKQAIDYMLAACESETSEDEDPGLRMLLPNYFTPAELYMLRNGVAIGNLDRVASLIPQGIDRELATPDNCSEEKAALHAKAAFLEKFCHCVNAGFPIEGMMRALAEETEHPATKQYVTGLLADFERGTSISGAPSGKTYLTETEVTMIRIGEETGRLDKVLVPMVKWADRELCKPKDCNENTLALQEKAAFLEKFAHLLGAAVPLEQVLSILHRETTHPATKEIAGAMSAAFAGKDDAPSFEEVLKADYFTSTERAILAEGLKNGELDRAPLLIVEAIDRGLARTD